MGESGGDNRDEDVIGGRNQRLQMVESNEKR